MNNGMFSFPAGIQNLLLWLVPIGVGFEWWGDEADIPGYKNGKFTYYILPVGQDIEQAVYPRLYGKWCKNGVHKYGAGSTNTSTKAPDKRGRISVAKDDMGGTAASRVTSGGSGINGATLGATGGAETVALAAANHASHAHNQTTGTGSGAVAAMAEVISYAGLSSGSTNTGSQGSGTAHQNMPPSIVCNYIIRAG